MCFGRKQNNRAEVKYDTKIPYIKTCSVLHYPIIIIHNTGSIFNQATTADHLLKMNPFRRNAACMQETFVTVMPFKTLMRSNKCCMEARF